MKAPHRRQDDETLDLFEWGQGRPANDTARTGSTFQRVPGGWVEKLGNGHTVVWKEMEGTNTMEPTSDDPRQLSDDSQQSTS